MDWTPDAVTLVVKTFVVVRAFDTFTFPVTSRDVKPGRPPTVNKSPTVTFPAAKMFVVVMAFEATTLPVTFRDVAPVEPCMVAVRTFAVDATFSVVE